MRTLQTSVYYQGISSQYFRFKCLPGCDKEETVLKYNILPRNFKYIQQHGKIETPREVTVLLKQQIVSAVKYILFCSELTLPPFKKKNCVNLCFNSLLKVYFKISFDQFFAYLKMICGPNKSLTYIDAVPQICATLMLQNKQWNVTNDNCQGYHLNNLNYKMLN